MGKLESMASVPAHLVTSEAECIVKDLTSIVERFKRDEQRPITDGHPDIEELVCCIEDLFRHGMKTRSQLLTPFPRDYWLWIEQLASRVNTNVNPSFNESVKLVSRSRRLTSLAGRGRCFIRLALTHKVITVPAQHLTLHKKLITYHFNKYAIMQQPKLTRDALGVLFELTEVDFELSMKTVTALEFTGAPPPWEMVTLKAVPKYLRMSCEPTGHVVVVEDMTEQVADCIESGRRLKRGDVIAELNGVSTFKWKPHILHKEFERLSKAKCPLVLGIYGDYFFMLHTPRPRHNAVRRRFGHASAKKLASSGVEDDYVLVQTPADRQQGADSVGQSDDCTSNREGTEVSEDNPFFGVPPPDHTKGVAIRDWW